MAVLLIARYANGVMQELLIMVIIQIGVVLMNFGFCLPNNVWLVFEKIMRVIGNRRCLEKNWRRIRGVWVILWVVDECSNCIAVGRGRKWFFFFFAVVENKKGKNMNRSSGVAFVFYIDVSCILSPGSEILQQYVVLLHHNDVNTMCSTSPGGEETQQIDQRRMMKKKTSWHVLSHYNDLYQRVSQHYQIDNSSIYSIPHTMRPRMTWNIVKPCCWWCVKKFFWLCCDFLLLMSITL